MIKSCDLLYADGSKYVWNVVTEDVNAFPIPESITAENSVWINNGIKKVLGSNGWVQSDPLPISENGTYNVKEVDEVAVNVEGGGGGDYPVFTLVFDTYSELESGTCDMTFAECKALCTAEYEYTYPCTCLSSTGDSPTVQEYDVMRYGNDDDGIVFYFGNLAYQSDGTIVSNQK